MNLAKFKKMAGALVGEGGYGKAGPLEDSAEYLPLSRYFGLVCAPLSGVPQAQTWAPFLASFCPIHVHGFNSTHRSLSIHSSCSGSPSVLEDLTNFLWLLLGVLQASHISSVSSGALYLLPPNHQMLLKCSLSQWYPHPSRQARPRPEALCLIISPSFLIISRSRITGRF